jgi:hypothetical protein
MKKAWVWDHGTDCRMNGDIREIGFRRRGEKAKKECGVSGAGEEAV